MKKEHKYWDLSINSIWHRCTKISAGCARCWVDNMKHYPEIAKRTNLDKPELHLEAFDVLKNKRKSQVVFLQLLGDLFHENISFEWIDNIFDTMTCDYYNHIFLICTKRPKRMIDYMDISFRHIGIKPDDHENIYFGVSVENQENLWRAEELMRLSEMGLKTWVSFEPLLGEIDQRDKSIFCDDYFATNNNGYVKEINRYKNFDFAIIGCETGPKKRLCKIEDIEFLVDQLRATNIPIWIKQIPLDGKVCYDLDKFPKDLQLREDLFEK